MSSASTKRKSADKKLNGECVFFSSRRRHTRYWRDWSSDVCSSDLLSVSFSGAQASPLPLLLVGLLVAVFLLIEARRYRFFDFWRMRAHVLELHFFGPILLGRGPSIESGWNEVLHRDYAAPHLHISLAEAAGRRLRRNYGWIFLIQVAAYAGKLLIHPEPIHA